MEKTTRVSEIEVSCELCGLRQKLTAPPDTEFSDEEAQEVKCGHPKCPGAKRVS